jgi:hypothetical protein
MELRKFIATTIREYLNESNNISDNVEIQQLIDIISINPDKYGKYIDILKTKYDIDFYNYYNDVEYIDKVDLNNIRGKNVFLNFDNYIKYAKIVFKKRNISQPKHIDKTVGGETIKNIGKELGFNVKFKEYSGSGSGNYAAFDLVDTVITPSKVDVNTLIHEIGHFFDHNYSNDYEGLAKTITYASSPYHIDKNNEVFAENFLHYFIAPNLLKSKLPEVYSELDGKIPNKFKTILNNLLK